MRIMNNWMHYKIVKQYNINGYGEFNLTPQKFMPDLGCKNEYVDTCDDLTKVLKDVLKEIKNEKF